MKRFTNTTKSEIKWASNFIVTWIRTFGVVCWTSLQGSSKRPTIGKDIDDAMQACVFEPFEPFRILCDEERQHYK